MGQGSSSQAAENAQESSSNVPSTASSPAQSRRNTDDGQQQQQQQQQQPPGGGAASSTHSSRRAHTTTTTGFKSGLNHARSLRGRLDVGTSSSSSGSGSSSHGKGKEREGNQKDKDRGASSTSTSASTAARRGILGRKEGSRDPPSSAERSRQQQQQQQSEASNGSNGESPSKPRRKSLDMPDLSLAMSTPASSATLPAPGGGPGSGSGAGVGGGNGSGSGRTSAGHGATSSPMMPTSTTSSSSSSTSTIFTSRHGDGEGLPLAHGPIVASPLSPNHPAPGSHALHHSNSISSRYRTPATGAGSSGAPSGSAGASTVSGTSAPRARENSVHAGGTTISSVTSPTSATSSNFPAGGVFSKKAQAITGNAAQLHAAGYTADKSKDSAPFLSTSPHPASFLSSSHAPQTAPSSMYGTPVSGSRGNSQKLPPIDTQTVSSSTPSTPLAGGIQLASAAMSPAEQSPAERILSPQRPTLQPRSDRDMPPSALGMVFVESVASPSPASSLPSGAEGTAAVQPNKDAAGEQDDAAGSVAPPLPSPLRQPIETILAPELPSNVTITVPAHFPIDAAHDIIPPSGLEAVAASSAALPRGSPALLLSPRAALSNPMEGAAAQDLIAAETQASDSLPASGGGAPQPSGGHGTMTASAGNASGFASPLLPGSTPPLNNPPNTLPAAAPIAALNPTLAQDPRVQQAVQAATVDLGAGPDGVPTLLTWKADEETMLNGEKGMQTGTPEKVFVTGTFAKGWNAKIELRRKEDDPKHAKDFTALVNLPPGPHSLKFIIDKQWKTSKYLPSATDADGNLINYLQVHKVDSVPRHHAVISEYEEVEDEATWTSEIPEVLLTYGDASEAALDYQEAQEAAAAAAQGSHHQSSNSLPPPALADFSSASSREASASNTPQGPSSIPAILPDPGMFALSRRPLAQLQQVQPPILPAQLEKGVLNATVLVAKGSGDDNSILPKPDHSVLNHLAASPIKGGLLSVGVTTRYRRKYVTTIYFRNPGA